MTISKSIAPTFCPNSLLHPDFNLLPGESVQNSNLVYIFLSTFHQGHAVSQLLEALHYKHASRGFVGVTEIFEEVKSHPGM
jgi:hypothetical protein